MFCPETIVLERFGRGELPADQVESVEAHLQGCDVCRRELERLEKPAPAGVGSGITLDVEAPAWPGVPLLDLPVHDHTPTVSPLPDGGSALFLERGTQVGRYVILEQLGSGGMGVVYAALDPELDRRVALKLLRSEGPELQGQPNEARLRLLREAQAMARLSHPNVITIYDVGSHGSQVYLAMELVEGVTLTEWLRLKRSWRDVVRVFCQAGRGLGAAHQAGLVHRDFKPDNVLVSPDGQVRVMDFGLARAANPGDERPWRPPDPNSGLDFLHSPLTRKGTVVGTPAYMSPEQFVDDPLDARSDQFSFCVALYEALYGELPFKGDTVKQLAVRVMGGQVPSFPPNARVPLAVHRAMVKGLSPSPADRHPSMEALVQALERATWVPRRALAVALGLAVLTGVAVWNYKTATLRQHACLRAEEQLAGIWDRGAKRLVQQAFQNTRAPYAEDTWKGVEGVLDAYTAQWISAHELTCEATWVRHEQPQEVFTQRMACLEQRRRELETLVTLFNRADAQVVEKAMQAASGLSAVGTCTAIDAASLRQAARSQPAAEVRTQVDELRGRLSEATALQGAGVFAKAIALCNEVVAGARRLHQRPLEAEGLLMLGRLTEQTGDYATAEQSLLEAYWAAEAGQRHDLAGRALTSLVTVVGQRLGRHQESLRWGRAAHAIIEGLGSPPDLLAPLLVNVAVVYAVDGQHAQALERLREALDLRERVLGAQHVDVAITLQELGTVYRALGRYEEALASHQRAVPIIERTYGPEHPRVARALNHEGIALKSLGRLAEARKALERALAIDERAFGPDAPSVAPSVINLASVLEEQGQLDDAIAFYRRALAIEERSAQPNPVRIAAVLNSIGDVYLKLGKHERALEHFEKALATRQQALGSDHFDVAKDLLGLGETYLAMKRVQDALPPLERALRIRQGHSGFPTTLARIRFNLARALWESRGDRARARELATQARDTYAATGAGNRAEMQRVDEWLARHQE